MSDSEKIEWVGAPTTQLELMVENKKLWDVVRFLEGRVQNIEALLLGAPLQELEAPPKEPQSPSKRKGSKTIEDIRKLLLKKSPSKTELVQLCKMYGFPEASHVHEVEDLLSALKGEEVHWYGDPFYDERNMTFEYIKDTPIATSLAKCDLDCMSCPNYRVAMCWTENGEKIEQYHREKEI
tara:strand:- start:1182 stop:1724 length:543 start_codon:yes stop_codon:yes gene_type:complete